MRVTPMPIFSVKMFPTTGLKVCQCAQGVCASNGVCMDNSFLGLGGQSRVVVKSWSSRHKKSERPGLLGTNKNFDANQNQQYQQSQQYQPYQQYQPQGWCNQMMSVAYFVSAASLEANRIRLCHSLVDCTRQSTAGFEF